MVERDLRALTSDEILQWVLSIGDKKFRAQQIQEWLWKKGATSVDQMTNLSHELREALKRDFQFSTARRKDEQLSNDGTMKCVFMVERF